MLTHFICFALTPIRRPPFHIMDSRHDNCVTDASMDKRSGGGETSMDYGRGRRRIDAFGKSKKAEHYSNVGLLRAVRSKWEIYPQTSANKHTDIHPSSIDTRFVAPQHTSGSSIWFWSVVFIVVAVRYNAKMRACHIIRITLNWLTRNDSAQEMCAIVIVLSCGTNYATIPG